MNHGRVEQIRRHDLSYCKSAYIKNWWIWTKN